MKFLRKTKYADYDIMKYICALIAALLSFFWKLLLITALIVDVQVNC